MREPYPSDLTDDQWTLIEPLIPVNSIGRPRVADMREVLNAIFYLNRAGCQWDMLPHDLPAESTVYDHFAQWRADVVNLYAPDTDLLFRLDEIKSEVRRATAATPERRCTAFIWPVLEHLTDFTGRPSEAPQDIVYVLRAVLVVWEHDDKFKKELPLFVYWHRFLSAELKSSDKTHIFI
jgi:hypothetical protein